MELFKKKKRMVTVQKFRPVFTTVDGNTHIGINYKYVIADRLLCSVPEYIMIDIKDNGYIQDNCYIMYPLANIVSINWDLIDEREIEDKFDNFQIFITKEEVDRCEPN